MNRLDSRPTLPVLSHLRSIVDEVFAIPPPVIQELEVAGIGYAAVLFQLRLTQDQMAQYAALGLAVYVAGKTITKALETLADAVSAARKPPAAG